MERQAQRSKACWLPVAWRQVKGPSARLVARLVKGLTVRLPA
jgi:hypothetical protein